MVPLKSIQDYADAIARRFKPERVILFGSYANGTATEDSDVDLLVVMEDGGDPMAQAIEIRCAIPRSFSLDLLVRNEKNLQWRLDERDYFMLDIIENGQTLYETQHA